MYSLPFTSLNQPSRNLIVGDSGQQRILGAALDHAAALEGYASWQPPALKTWQQHLRQSFEFSSGNAELQQGFDFVLSSEQELALWQRVIREDAGFDSPATEQIARGAQLAWRLQRSWELPAPRSDSASQDCAAFARWSDTFTTLCRQLHVCDATRLLDAATANPQSAAVGGVHGLFEPPPRVMRWLDSCGVEQQTLERETTARFHGHCYAERRDEYRAAVTWIAAQMEANPAARIALVTPNGEWRESELQTVLDECFGVGNRSPVCWAQPHQTLHNRPLLRLALAVLNLGLVPRWDFLSEVINHPLLAGADLEWSARARLDDDLRGFERYELPLAFVLNRMTELDTCAQLQQMLRRLSTELETQAKRQSMSEWFAHFDRCLRAVAWPGPALQDDSQIEAFEFWQQTCDHLAKLDAVSTPVNRATALSRLNAALQSPYNSPVRPSQVFVVNAAQALALQPTAVWVLGCESEHLAVTPRLSPLLPIADQRAAGVPGSDPKQSLWLTRVLLEGLAFSASNCQASFVQAEGEVPYTPSPLIPALAAATIAPASHWIPSAWQGAPREMESVIDDYGEPLPRGATIGGGVAALSAHNACPFRGFARSRLGASRLSVPLPGISFRLKGIFVHRVLATLWESLGDQAALLALSNDGREALIAQALDQNLGRLPFETAIEKALHFIERDRLLELIDNWLAFEGERAPFTVIATEQQYRAELADFVLTTRIDRVDKLEDQDIQIIDYKTGACSINGWLAPRMDDPQLPFYIHTAPAERVDSIAFAAIDADDPRWLEWRPDKHSELAPEAQWVHQRQQWLDDLEQTVQEIGAGLAIATPKYDEQTCLGCEQALVCRRAEWQRRLSQERDGDLDE